MASLILIHLTSSVTSLQPVNTHSLPLPHCQRLTLTFSQPLGALAAATNNVIVTDNPNNHICCLNQHSRPRCCCVELPRFDYILRSPRVRSRFLFPSSTSMSGGVVSQPQLISFCCSIPPNALHRLHHCTSTSHPHLTSPLSVRCCPVCALSLRHSLSARALVQLPWAVRRSLPKLSPPQRRRATWTPTPTSTRPTPTCTTSGRTRWTRWRPRTEPTRPGRGGRQTRRATRSRWTERGVWMWVRGWWCV